MHFWTSPIAPACCRTGWRRGGSRSAARHTMSTSRPYASGSSESSSEIKMNLPTALRLVACGVALSVTLGAQGQTPTPAASPRPTNAPRLLVVLVLDQFRADYIEMYGRQ